MASLGDAPEFRLCAERNYEKILRNAVKTDNLWSKSSHNILVQLLECPKDWSQEIKELSSVQEGNWLSLLIGLAASSASRFAFSFGSRVDFCCSQICMAKQIADVYKINTSLEQMHGLAVPQAVG